MLIIFTFSQQQQHLQYPPHAQQHLQYPPQAKKPTPYPSSYTPQVTNHNS
jgi:hypothetical protein